MYCYIVARKIYNINKCIVGWLCDSSGDDKVRDENKNHRRAQTEPGIGKEHNKSSELKSNSRVSVILNQQYIGELNYMCIHLVVIDWCG